jgi:predicted MFS family arabinose efflux permease
MESNMSIAHTTATVIPIRTTLTTPLIFLLAASTGLSVAALYYSQPTLGVLATDLHASNQAVGWIPTLTQFGYALGLLATVAQDIVPAAATLAPAAHRGRIVGTVMTGLLLGILLSRVVGGLVAEALGWRAVFGGAAVVAAFTTAILARGLPSFKPTSTSPYPALLGSLFALWKEHRALRLAAMAQGLLSIGFSAFWSTLAVMLHGAPFHLGSAAAGSFGLAGAVGALAAPFAGRLADRRGPQFVTRLGAGLSVASFGIMFAMPHLPTSAQLVLLALATVGFDLGVQATMIAHQTIVYGIAPEARSRLNAIFMTTMFVGMAAGGALGAQALAAWGWNGIVLLAVASSLAALAVRIRAASAQ